MGRYARMALYVSLLLVGAGCGKPDDGHYIDNEVGCMSASQVVVCSQWEKFLNNVTGYTFSFNKDGFVDTVRYRGGYASFVYYAGSREVQTVGNDMVDLRLHDMDGVVNTVCTFVIGVNGYAKRCTEVRVADNRRYDWRFKYDHRGYLTSLDAAGDECEFEYVDGNLVAYTNWCDGEETYVFTYSSLSSFGYMPYFQSPGYIEADYGPILPLAYFAGLVGRPSKNLPSVCDVYVDDEYVRSYEYRYVFNNDGELVNMYY